MSNEDPDGIFWSSPDISPQSRFSRHQSRSSEKSMDALVFSSKQDPIRALIQQAERHRGTQNASDVGFMSGFVQFNVPITPLDEKDLRTAFPVLNSLPHPVLWISSCHEIFWSNPAAQEMYKPVTGRCHMVCHRHRHPCSTYGEPCPMCAATALGTAVSVAHVHQADSTTKFLEVTAIPIVGGGVIEIHIPVADFFATDALTGTNTRAFFEQATRRELALMRRIKLPYALVMVDLDHFKLINDQHGHPAGDRVLQAVGGSITDCIRETDSAGRWGGEEFCIFLPGIDDDGGAKLVRRIQENIRAIETTYCACTLRITASFGIYSSNTEYVFNKAVRLADTALYRAKKLGRDRIEIWEPLGKK